MLADRRSLRNGDGLARRVAVDTEREGPLHQPHNDFIALGEPTQVYRSHINECMHMCICDHVCADSLTID
jgi:hypothetical protein